MDAQCASYDHSRDNPVLKIPHGAGPDLDTTPMVLDHQAALQFAKAHDVRATLQAQGMNGCPVRLHLQWLVPSVP